MSRVVTNLAPSLKAARFRKRRHGFNRRCADELVQVVHFQMGPKLPPGASAVPPIRPDLHGTFTINLGVRVPVLAERLGPPQSRDWVNEYQCHLRQRVGMLFPEPADTWWYLADSDTATEAARQALDEFALPWLDSVGAASDIVRLYQTKGRHAVGLGPAAPLQMALLYMDFDDVDSAEQLLREYLAGELNEPHRRYLAELLPQLDLGYLIAE